MDRYQSSRQSEEDPYFNVGRLSKRLCIGGLVFCWLVGIASLAVGLYLVKTGGVLISDLVIEGHPFTIPGGIAASFNKYAQELAPLGLNILITICTDVTGYIHTVSLRWALQKESRLTFNSNLRLFTSARKSKANTWYTNLIMAIFMVMSYTSTSLLSIRETNVTLQLLPPSENTFVCGYAAITLAIAILGQASIATLCLPGLMKIPTWSSDPLEIVAAYISLGGLHHEPGRCMRSVHDLKEAAQPVFPSHQQKSVFLAHKEVRIVFWYMWVPVVYAVMWGGVIKGILGGGTVDGDDGLVRGNNWSFFPNVDTISGDWETRTPSASIGWISNTAQTFDFVGFLCAFIIIAVIQAIITLSLHCAELLVNTIRDERSWRDASKRGHRCLNALSSMLSSFPALVLFTLKPVIHWLYSLAVSVYFSQGIIMRAPQIFYLGGSAALLAIFTTICAFWRPEGPQPAAFGHLQTLADLVDMWPKLGERMFWGQKDPADSMLRDNNHIWHAGTAAERLDSVDFGKEYMGLARCRDLCPS